jgi:hypothetical protein
MIGAPYQCYEPARSLTVAAQCRGAAMRKHAGRRNDRDFCHRENR